MKPFEEYVRLLLHLHTLVDSGRGESSEADAVRDKMDRPHLALSEEERRIVALVSEALYGPKPALLPDISGPVEVPDGAVPIMITTTKT